MYLQYIHILAHWQLSPNRMKPPNEKLTKGGVAARGDRLEQSIWPPPIAEHPHRPLKTPMAFGSWYSTAPCIWRWGTMRRWPTPLRVTHLDALL